MKQQELFICVVDGDNYDYKTISTKRKTSVERALERANKNYHPLYYQWKHLRGWGYKCVKVNVKTEKLIINL